MVMRHGFKLFDDPKSNNDSSPYDLSLIGQPMRYWCYFCPRNKIKNSRLLVSTVVGLVASSIDSRKLCIFQTIMTNSLI